MDVKPQAEATGRSPDHQAHEQRLAAALRELVNQIDVGDYRDKIGHPLGNNLAFLKAQAGVDEFGLKHEQLCQTLDDCELSGDLGDAARKIFALRQARPESMPPDTRSGRPGRSATN